jgi:mannose-6-phosphate isomerase-like protein (cupin superfamily)
MDAKPREKDYQKQLEAEGFTHTFVWQDGPNAFYPAHTHARLTAHIILDGEMTLAIKDKTAGKSQTYRAGERCDVPAGAVHSARMGPSGCRYLVGEK